VFGSSPNFGMSFLNLILFIFVYVVLAQINCRLKVRRKTEDRLHDV
jgi:hypothetical protein